VSRGDVPVCGPVRPTFGHLRLYSMSVFSAKIKQRIQMLTVRL